jgi:folate-binding protein YgfZ
VTVTLDSANAAARTSALIVGEAERGVLLVAGSDRVAWLNGVVTADVAKVTAGSASFGLLLSKVGKIQSDFYLFARGEELALALAPGTEALVLGELERMLVMEDAELRSATSELACLAVHGPKALGLASAVATLEGVTSAALDRTGLGGAVLLVPRARLDEVTASLVAGGGVLATREAWQLLRVERRVGVFGIDYGPSDNPHEAALDRVAVSWTKGCYLGQEVVFMQDARGKLKRRLAQLELEGPSPPPGAPVTDAAGEPVGEVTSVAEGSVHGRSLALARVKAPHHEPGVRLAAGGLPAVVRAEPV